MHLATALRFAIPFAMHDRRDLAQAYGQMGPDAEAATQACSDLLALVGIKPAKFSDSQRETARLALLWAEQYLDGYIDALGESSRHELKIARRQRMQIRKARFDHFGATALEVMSQRAKAVDVMTLLRRQV